MFRKITLGFAVLLTMIGTAQARNRAVGSAGTSDAALAPMAVPGATVSGTVTAVNGNLISLANGLVVIDATGAKITDEKGNAGTNTSIPVGSTIFVVLSSSSVSANAPLPAAIIAVHRTSQVELTGPVQAVGPSSLTVLGRTINVDANTSFGGVHGLNEVVVNEIVTVHANAVNGVLVAASVLVYPPMPQKPTVIHGTVKSIGTSSWVITDKANKDWTIVINAQTKIIGDPKVGDPVEILVNTDNANQLVAVSIMKSIVITPMIVFSGSVKSITATEWVVTDAKTAHDIAFAVNAQTKIAGDPKVNDGVIVTATIDSAGKYTATSIIKLGIVPPAVTLSGVVKSIMPSMSPCSAGDCIVATWTIGPAAGMGPDFLVLQLGKTKVVGDPRVGDKVSVTGQPGSGGFIATEITKH